MVRHFGNWKLKSFGLRPRSIRLAAVTPGCLVFKTILVALCLSRFLARLFPHAVKFMKTDSLGLRPRSFPTTASFPKRLCLSAWTRSAFPSVVLVLKIFWVFSLQRCARAYAEGDTFSCDDCYFFAKAPSPRSRSRTPEIRIASLLTLLNNVEYARLTR